MSATARDRANDGLLAAGLAFFPLSVFALDAPKLVFDGALRGQVLRVVTLIEGDVRTKNEGLTLSDPLM